MIERIEIIRGPASILYGSDAIGGVIHYITRLPKTEPSGLALHGRFGLSLGSVNRLAAQSMSLDASGRSWALLLGGQLKRAGNISTPDGKLSNTGFSGYTLQSKLRFVPAERHSLMLHGQAQRFRDVGIPVNAYATEAKFTRYDRTAGALSYDFSNPAGRFSSVHVNLYAQEGDRDFSALIEGVPKGPRFVTQNLTARRDVRTEGGHVQIRYLLPSSHQFTAGIDVQRIHDRSARTSDAQIIDAGGTVVADPPPDTAPPTPRASQTSYGVYLENEYMPQTRLSLLAGLRYDLHTAEATGTSGTLVETDQRENDADWSGNAGILFRVTPALRLTGTIGRAFSAPTLLQRYFRGTAQVGHLQGNPGLRSETSSNIDIGIKWFSAKTSGEVSMFRNHIDNYIVMAPVSAAADSFIYKNVGEAVLTGGEFHTDLRISRNVSGTLSASLVYGEDVSSSTPLPKIPPLRGRFTLRYCTSDETFTAETTLSLNADQGRTDRYESVTPGYGTIDICCSFTLSEYLPAGFPLYLTCAVQNVTNERYIDHLSAVTWWPAPGRNINIGLKGTF